MMEAKLKTGEEQKLRMVRKIEERRFVVMVPRLGLQLIGGMDRFPLN